MRSLLERFIEEVAYEEDRLAGAGVGAGAAGGEDSTEPEASEPDHEDAGGEDE
jgi:hypothetical protein